MPAKRENNSTTYLCGCSLKCGIVTVAVFSSLGLVANVALFNWAGFTVSLLDVASLFCLFVWNDTSWARTLNYAWQNVKLAVLIIF